MYQGTTLQNDSETQAKLFDWFQFRELNYEDDKFLVMYKRNLDMYYPKYKVLLEDEVNFVFNIFYSANYIIYFILYYVLYNKNSPISKYIC